MCLVTDYENEHKTQLNHTRIISIQASAYSYGEDHMINLTIDEHSYYGKEKYDQLKMFIESHA